MQKLINEEMQNIIDELKNSPTYAMSLGAKELFHSNFWKWLIEYGEENHSGNNPFATMFFNDLKGKKGLEVKREQGHRDITIWWTAENEKKHGYIIENKLKSIADAEQLEKYETNFKKNENLDGKVLTGISDDLTKEERHGWNFISYEDIAKSLDKYLEEYETDKSKFEIKLIESYAKDIHNISELIKTLLEENSKKMPDPELCKKLDEVKLGDVYKKKQSCKFKYYLDNSKTIKSIKCPPDFKIKTDKPGFSNGNASVTVFLQNNPEFRIGIQIQGSQYRRFVEKKDTKESFEKVFDEYLSRGWFGTKKDGKLFGQETPMANKFNRFNPYRFVYQYYTIQDYSFAALEKIIKEDLVAAAEIIKNK